MKLYHIFIRQLGKFEKEIFKWHSSPSGTGASESELIKKETQFLPYS